MAQKRQRPNGRPSKLDPRAAASICQFVELCGSVEDAAAKAGVARTTVWRWLQKGREQEHGPFREFCDAIEDAKAKRRFNFGAQMQKHGLKHWQAIAWLAERTDPKHFGLRIKVQVHEEMERVLDKLQRTLPPQEYERALEALSQPDDSSEETGSAPGHERPNGPGHIAGLGAALDAALPEPEPSP